MRESLRLDAYTGNRQNFCLIRRNGRYTLSAHRDWGHSFQLRLIGGDNVARLTGKVAFIIGATDEGQSLAHAVRLAEEGASTIAADLWEPSIHRAVANSQATAEDLGGARRLVQNPGGCIDVNLNSAWDTTHAVAVSMVRSDVAVGPSSRGPRPACGDSAIRQLRGVQAGGCRNGDIVCQPAGTHEIRVSTIYLLPHRRRKLRHWC